MSRYLFVFAPLLLIGCERDVPCVTWNPATTPPQCQACDTAPDGSTVFVGPLLKASECAGQPTPIVVQPEVQ